MQKRSALPPSCPMASDLHSLIAGMLQSMTHAELSEAPLRIAGLVVPTGEDLSKRQRINLALAKLTEEELARLALKFAAQRGDVPLDEAGRKLLEARDPPLIQITRRDVARIFGDDLAGERGTVEMSDAISLSPHPLKISSGAAGEACAIRSLGIWIVIPVIGRLNICSDKSAHSTAPQPGSVRCSKKLFTPSLGRERSNCRRSPPSTTSLRATDSRTYF